MITGIHHVTALASTPQPNVDFYVGVLGLRLIKQTVNFDDPTVYHLYYGDGVGTPGTLMTFFPYGHILPGKRGTGETFSVTFEVPTGTLDWWHERLAVNNIPSGEEVVFGKRVVWGLDPDGLRVEFEEYSDETAFSAWEGSPVPADKAIRTIRRVTLTPNDPMGERSTESLISKTMEFRTGDSEGGRTRYYAGSSEIDIVRGLFSHRFQSSAGTIHHVAFRNIDDASQAEWRQKIVDAGYNITPFIDRDYFHSLYFREPGGVLFELATDAPGFAIDEDIEHLGERLQLPEQYEHKREYLQSVLAPIKVPNGVNA